MAKYNTNTIFKFANHTTVVGQISDDQTKYRKKTLMSSGQEKNLALSKIKMER